MPDERSLSGESVATWVLLDPGPRLRLLIGIEWADAVDVWRIEEAAKDWLRLVGSQDGTRRSIPFGKLASGDIYFDPDSEFWRVWQLTESPFDQKHRAALDYFRAVGAPIGERLPATIAVNLHQELIAGGGDPRIPSAGCRYRINVLLKGVEDTGVLRWAARLMDSWLVALCRPPPLDGEASLRIQIAALARRAGLVDLGLEVTAPILGAPTTMPCTSEQETILCVERASLLLDRISVHAHGEHDDRACMQVDRLLRRAWRLSDGGNEYARAVYVRFNRVCRSSGGTAN